MSVLRDSPVLVPVTVQRLLLDPVSHMPVVVLRAKEDQRVLPIWIGEFEANAIAMHLERVEPPRPMTHDLLSAAVSGVGAKVERIVVTRLVETTFLAEIHLRLASGEALVLDSRPSDAIALALRHEAALLVAAEVLDTVRDGKANVESDEEPRLEDFGPEVLGKYTM